MASILLTVGVLSYDQIKKQKAKRAAKKEEHNSARYSELEAENARRITALQNNTCFCQTSDWRGGNCERHGYVPAAGEPGGPPLAAREGEKNGDAPPEYEEREKYRDATTLRNRVSDPQQQRLHGEMGYQYQRGEADGSSLPSQEGDVARINGERRKKMKAGGFANWSLKRKEGKREAIVR